ncbi:glucose-6-phosphate isomerase [Patescibacteria group bacterium]|nr:glucose-6-phosphate isomerase [Patescibacteria group bacterium]
MKQKYTDYGQKGNKTNAIIFGGKERIPSVRYVQDMKEVILDQEWAEKNKSLPLYYMYRDLAESEKEAEKIKAAELRYDILESVPVILGKEYNKTAGHYHSKAEDTNFTYPELYELIKGDAYYLMQKMEGDKIIDVYAVRAKSGDKVLMPPGYGHFTFFLSKDPIRMSNWTPGNSLSNYEQIKRKHGAAYYALVDKKAADGIWWVKNGNYSEVPPLRFLKPTNFEDIGLAKNVNMYGLAKSLGKLDYLNNPQNYPELWERILRNK